MKISILSILLFGFIISCTSTSKPPTWVDYYSFITSEENDLFNTYPEYNINEILYGQPGVRRGFDYIDSIGTIYRLGLQSHMRHEESYIDYGNGDIDTLNLSWKPSTVPIGEVFYFKSKPFEAVDEVSLFFNGELVGFWDFKSDPGLRRDFTSRNSGTSDNPDYDPLVIILNKDPDWDELN